ncbi:MAG TPA: WD40 repeat domain-containing serine/threonine protein kinase [Candidatus Limnocylindrales bacterium]|nr:WD40 repeat domain-containing serine/threonine protein kinase [Candidatus Limnocylindrales bacterium]
MTERPGDRIGRYRLLQEIGHGGCGVVYMAEQEAPVRRKVAVKVIKLGMDTRQVVARFEAERQALALMDHPSIAKVLDAGATDTGRPFFVMELVGGVKITDYCNQNKLIIRQRLDLVIQVCKAIQHAHQKGIIHRDIKPSNVLVATQDGVPVPKVIDFGIAKATQGKLTDQTLFTAFEQFLGTPAYMSPEQAQLGSLDVDTRSDIYSLGVLLYELLTGKTPFDTKALVSAGLDEMRRTIREVEPVRPSTRLTQERGATSITLRRSEVQNSTIEIDNDLDWIVMKCLEKERARRYETASGLARDIERHLNNQPVLARPPSKFYEFQKTVRRHKVGFAATGVVIAALTVGVIASTWQTVRARRAESRESRQKVEALQNLYKSLMREARATRLARRVGYREKVIALIEQAETLDVPERNFADLRQEAVACLGDFVGLLPTTFAEFSTNIEFACMAPSGKLAAFALSDRTIHLRETQTGKEAARLAYSNEKLWALCFNYAGDHLYAVTGPLSTNRTPTRADCDVNVWPRDTNGNWGNPMSRTVPCATKGLFSTDEGVYDVILEAERFESLPENSPMARFRLFNLTTNGFVPDYEVTGRLRGKPDSWVSGDGKLLAVDWGERSNPDGSFFLTFYEWGESTNLNRLQLPAEAEVSLSGDGKYVFVSRVQDGAIYSVPGLERIAQFKEIFGPDTFIICAGKLAFSRAQQNRVRLWHLAKGEDIAMLDEPEGGKPSSFTPSGSALLTTGSRQARLYRLSTPEKVELPSHSASVPGVAFSPDGLRLASAAKDHSVRLSDAMTGRVLWETNDLPGQGQCLGFSPDGKWLAVGTWDRYVVWILDAQTGKRLLELASSTPGLSVPRTEVAGSRERIVSVQFSPDGHYLAVAGVPYAVRIYTIQRHETGQPSVGQEPRSFNVAQCGGTGLVFSPNSHSVAFSRASNLHDEVDEYLYLWDFLGSAEPRRARLWVSGGVESCNFTPDGRHLIAIDNNGSVVTLDVTTAEPISSFPAWKPQPGQPAVTTQFIALSPDGSKLAVSSGSRLGVDIRDPQTGRVFYSLPEEARTVLWLAWSPDNQRLAVSRDAGDIAIWDLAAINKVLARLGLNP